MDVCHLSLAGDLYFEVLTFLLTIGSPIESDDAPYKRIIRFSQTITIASKYLDILMLYVIVVKMTLG